MTIVVPGGGSGGSGVSSFNGRTGAVVPQAGDYSGLYDALGAAAAAQAAAIAASDPVGSAATAQANAETFATSAANTAQSNAEAFATSAANAAQAAAIAASAQGLVPTALMTTAYTAAPGDFVPCSTAAGAFTVKLPNAPADKTRIGIKLIIIGSTLGLPNLLTYQCQGSDTLNATVGNGGVTSGTLNVKSHSETFQYQASTGIWYLQAGDTPLDQLDTRYGMGAFLTAESSLR